MRGQKWILEKHFDGEPKEECLQLVDEELPDQIEENGNLTLRQLISLYI
jgi:hypothetical protein